MGRHWPQLRLLLWKNYLLRRRQKLRTAVELLWPLVLFLILMWVRTRGLKSYIHECHFESKAMPSAGIVPFVRSFVCTMNNTCHRRAMEEGELVAVIDNETAMGNVLHMFHDIVGRIKSDNVAQMITVAEDLQVLGRIFSQLNSNNSNSIDPTNIFNFDAILTDQQGLSDAIKSSGLHVSHDVMKDLLASQINVDALDRSFLVTLLDDPKQIFCNASLVNDMIRLPNGSRSSTESVTEQLCSLTSNESLKLVSEFQKRLNVSALLHQLDVFVKTYSKGYEVHWEDWISLYKLATNISSNLPPEFGVRSEKLSQVLATFRDQVSRVANKYADFGSGSSQMLATIASFQLLMCGETNPAFLSELADRWRKTTRLDEIRDQIRDQMSKEDLGDAFPDEEQNKTDVSPACQELFHNMERNRVTRFLWNQVKAFVRGKIPYAPNNTAVNALMERLSLRFDIVNKTQKAAEILWSDIIPQARLSVNNSRELFEQINVVLNSKQAKSVLDLIGNVFLNSSTSNIDRLGQNDLTDLTVQAYDILDKAENMTKLIEEYLGCFDTDKIEGYRTEDEAYDRGMDLLGANELWAVLVFDVDENATVLPPFVRYKIRMDSDKVDGTSQVEDRIVRPGPRRRPGVDLKYITYGFAYLQDMLEQEIIITMTGRNETDMPGIWLQQFPYPCYINDQFTVAIARTFPLFMTLSWVYTSAMIIRSIVHEKEKRLKETLKAMGMANGCHWVAWFIDASAIMTVTCLALATVLVYGNIVENSSWSLIFVFLLLHAFATVAKCFLVSTFFSKANLAAACGGILYFVFYLPYPMMVLWENRVTFTEKMISSLLSNVAFGFGCSYLALFEETGIGAHWENFTYSPRQGDPYSLAFCMVMQVLDALIYFILTWYIEAVFPGQYGAPRKWYFCIQRSYWFGESYKWENKEDEYIPLQANGVGFEPDPIDLPLGVSIQKLSKVYSNGKVAVENLNLNFYENQITAFLGHNGAGKTTTISILTGLLTPTAGTAKVYGQDIRTDLDLIRKNLGICPQHNVLFDHLTVEEHLEFYSRLKGMSNKISIENEIKNMVDELGLIHKKKEVSSKLSGGMQRKLSVAVAFVGGSRTVILDEPTSGVDPYSRRNIWEMLLRYRQGRTIILTTHFMDEADLLGNRIAIISSGSLQCCGSSLFLKSCFGSGYYLYLVRKEREGNEIDVDAILHLLRKHVPDAILAEDVGSELAFVLPVKGIPPGTFQKLFQDLDKNMENLGISSYGVSDTTLEEIFLKVASVEVNEDHVFAKKQEGHRFRQRFEQLRKRLIGYGNNVADGQIENGTAYPMVQTAKMTESSRKDGWSLRWKQFQALIIKRFHHSRRNVKGFFCEIILPAALICLTMAFTRILPYIGSEPPLELHPWQYGPPNYVFWNSHAMPNSTNEWPQIYEQTILEEASFGARCVDGDPIDGHPCDRDVPPPSVSSLQYLSPFSMKSPECSCATGTPTCPAGAGGPEPPDVYIDTTDYFQNMTGRNISDWIVKTNRDYFKKRYGGFEVGISSLYPQYNFTAFLSYVLDKFNTSDDSVSRFVSILNDVLPAYGGREDNIRVWFDNKGWVSSVAYMNAMNNVVLRSSLTDGSANQSAYGLSVINHPMGYTEEQTVREILRGGSVSLLHSISVIFAMSFVPASFVVYLVEERASRSKHLQLVSGISPYVYWTSNFAYDFVNYLIPAALCLFIFLAFNEVAYVSPNNLPATAMLLLLYGWATIPFMYPSSFVFSESSTAFVVLACVNLFIGVVSTVSTFVLELFDDDELKEIGAVLKIVFLIFPHYCFGRGLMELAANEIASASLGTFGFTLTRNRFAWNFLGRNLLCMFVEGIVAFLLVLVIQTKFIHWGWRIKPGAAARGENVEDEDVLKERQRVKSGNADSDVLLINDLSKAYKRGRFLAVNRLCLGVTKGECFGLLGVNGAGKTTTFKMLTGAVMPSEGSASIQGHVVTRRGYTWSGQKAPFVGYCPQEDALDPLMNGREHLRFYARLRGCSEQQAKELAETSLQKLGLSAYATVSAGTYSGGNRRKLSTAIALLGNPPLVFLDEPTSGMDPQSRRFLWTRLLSAVRDYNACIVLTSHSMEECEALCSRLAIMVNGTLRCFGSVHHLKNRFGSGYTITLRCTANSVDDVAKRVSELLPESQLYEKHCNQLQYRMPSNSDGHGMPVSEIFALMEQIRSELSVEDFSVSQTTLDEVFVHFAREQSEMWEELQPVIESRL